MQQNLIEKNMKKYKVLFLAFLFSILLTSCDHTPKPHYKYYETYVVVGKWTLTKIGFLENTTQFRWLGKDSTGKFQPMIETYEKWSKLKVNDTILVWSEYE
jgi:hypothetical protein